MRIMIGYQYGSGGEDVSRSLAQQLHAQIRDVGPGEVARDFPRQSAAPAEKYGRVLLELNSGRFPDLEEEFRFFIWGGGRKWNGKRDGISRYDLVINSNALGLDGTAELLRQFVAVKTMRAYRRGKRVPIE